MKSNSALIASFAQDAKQFAFQADKSLKNSIDIYPLDSDNDYHINSSLVSHIDYESNDLKASDVIFIGWCSSAESKSAVKNKRKHDQNGNEDITNVKDAKPSENFLVNTFPDGKIVVYSSNGKDIINIIQNKYEITHADTDGEQFWFLDSDKTVKIFLYNQTKAVKTFHLTDGKNDVITGFQVLKCGEETILEISTDKCVYFIDPSKRRPTTLSKFEVENCIDSAFSNDGKSIALATEDKLAFYNFDSGSLLNTLNTASTKLEIVGDYLLSLSTTGSLEIISVTSAELVSRITVASSKIIDYSIINDSVLVAWLNVNEPNFTRVSFSQIKNNEEINLNEGKDSSKIESIEKITAADEKLKSNKKNNSTKLSKAKEHNLFQNLLQSLGENESDETIISLLLSEVYTEDKIKTFITNLLKPDELAFRLFFALSNRIQKNPWDENDVLLLWLEWLLICKNELFALSKDKHITKQVKKLKASLKPATETLPVILGMQGRLEMLQKQATLREDLAELNFNEDSNNNKESIDSVDKLESGDEEASITYANGESDVFLDASEY